MTEFRGLLFVQRGVQLTPLQHGTKKAEYCLPNAGEEHWEAQSMLGPKRKGIHRSPKASQHPRLKGKPQILTATKTGEGDRTAILPGHQCWTPFSQDTERGWNVS